MSKQKKAAIITAVVLIVAMLAVAAFWYRDGIRGILPLLRPAPEAGTAPTPGDPHADGTDPAPAARGGVNNTNIPLEVPPGFVISIFAQDLPGARVMAFDDFGNMWVSQPPQGTVSMLEIGDDGEVVRQGAVLRNLRRPHGLAFDPAHPFALYVAEEHRVARVATYSDGPIEKIADLPPGGNHFSRTIGFGPDGRLYVSIGSTCNVCREEDDRRAAILSMGRDGGDIRHFARGLRNAVFFEWHPETREMWATEMGRDRLGDDTPPDEINVVREGGHYGWPLCYGKNVPDTDFDPAADDLCREPDFLPSRIDIQAHSAPLGLEFLHGTAAGWPEEYRNDLIVAYHGSWNRSVPTGYKLVRFKFDEAGAYEGAEDFISGWLAGGRVYGRPVDVSIGPDGALYVSDDRAGVIYRLSYES